MEQLLTIGIVGVIVSLLVELLGTSNLSATKKKLLVVGVSIVAGLVYFFVKDTVFFESFLAILGTATVFYDYVVKSLK